MQISNSIGLLFVPLSFNCLYSLKYHLARSSQSQALLEDIIKVCINSLRVIYHDMVVCTLPLFLHVSLSLMLNNYSSLSKGLPFWFTPSHIFLFSFFPFCSSFFPLLVFVTINKWW